MRFCAAQEAVTMIMILSSLLDIFLVRRIEARDSTPTYLPIYLPIYLHTYLPSLSVFSIIVNWEIGNRLVSTTDVIYRQRHVRLYYLSTYERVRDDFS